MTCRTIKHLTTIVETENIVMANVAKYALDIIKDLEHKETLSEHDIECISALVVSIVDAGHEVLLDHLKEEIDCHICLALCIEMFNLGKIDDCFNRTSRAAGACTG